jgi:hypothetical protein
MELLHVIGTSLSSFGNSVGNSFGISSLGPALLPKALFGSQKELDPSVLVGLTVVSISILGVFFRGTMAANASGAKDGEDPPKRVFPAEEVRNQCKK